VIRRPTSPGAFRQQLALLVTLTSALAVGLAAVGTLGYEARQAYVDAKEASRALARIIAANSAGALAFDDADAARETLQSLAVNKAIVLACLYDSAGRPVAVYRSSGTVSDPPQRPTMGAEIGPRTAGHLVLFEPVRHRGDPLGTLFMEVDVREGFGRRLRALTWLGFGFVAATALALLLSGRLQRHVSRPILELSNAIRRVRDRRDYAIRVNPDGSEELRELTIGFNDMLSEIQQRDAALRAAHNELVQRVDERARQLVHEIGERHRTEIESELRARRLQLQAAALESAADAVAITDRNKVIEWVNPSFCSLLGYTAGEVMGRSALRMTSGRAEDAQLYEDLNKTVEAGKVWDGELIAKRADGRLLLIAQTVTPVLDAVGAISHYVAVMRDVSERRRVELQLRQAQKMEAVGRLSGGVAHDFNNLLSVIIGFSEQLLSKLPADERLLRYGREILKAAQRGASLTRQLLAFSRQQILRPRVVSLNATIADMERMLVRLIGEDIELITSLDPQLGWIEIDPGQLEQVIMNLAVNARDAMPHGGRLVITTANVDLTPADAKRCEFPAVPGCYVQLVFTDAGTGMDADTLAHIFEPFFTTKPMDRGSGLGLATVYGVVEQSKGYISVDSRLGEGTTFTILLPRTSAGVSSQAVAEDPAASPTGRETLLLVEDDDAARELTSEVLEDLGYQVIAASNGVEALDAAARHAGRIDLLLSDVVMPKLGGRELAQHLRDARPQLRVIFMSGYTADTVLRQGIAGGEETFLQKPFGVQQLGRIIRETLDAAH
jgi:PAS domain S-box-containing protein